MNEEIPVTFKGVDVGTQCNGTITLNSTPEADMVRKMLNQPISISSRGFGNVDGNGIIENKTDVEVVIIDTKPLPKPPICRRIREGSTEFLSKMS